MDDPVLTTVMFAEFVNLRMAVVTAGDAVIGARGLDLLIFDPAELKALLFITGL